MSSFLDDLEAQLVAAARSRTAHATSGGPPPRRPRRWSAALLRNLPVLAGVAVTLAIVVTAFALLGHAHRGSTQAASSPGALLSNIPPARMREEAGYIRAAAQQVQASPVCRTTSPTRTTIIRGLPGRDLLSTLAVLRRPASSADRLPAQALQSVVQPVYGDDVRLARVVGHTRYYVVPTREDLAATEPSARCFELQAAAVHRYAPRIPASIRAQTLALADALIAFDRSMIANAPRDTLCLVTIGGYESGADCGITAVSIRQRGSGPNTDSGRLSQLVPDGVATVTLHFPAAGGQPARTVTGRVVANLMVAYAPHLPAGSTAQPTAVWRAADGRILKTITPPTAAQIKAYCQKHEALCGTVALATSSSGSVSGSSTVTSSSSSATATTANP